MEMIRNGRRIDTRCEPSPARPMFLSFTRRERAMGRPSGLLRPRSAQRVVFGEVLSHYLVDLRLRVRFESHVDRFEDAATLHDDTEMSGRFGVAEDFFEVADRGLKCRSSIDCHESIARPEIDAVRGAVRDDGLDCQTRIQLHELHAEIASAGKHLTDVLLALARGSR